MTRAQLLAALAAERFPSVAQLEAEVIAQRRRVLNDALLPGRPFRGRRQMRTRLHRPRLLVRHLEGEPRPWESREAWMDEMCDVGWTE